MRIEDINNKKVAIATFFVASILCLISFFTLNSTLIILSFFFLLASILSYNYAYIFVSLISRFFGFEQSLTHYKISKERNCILTDEPPRASFVIEIKMKKESSNEIEKLIKAIDFPFKLEIALSKENANKIIDSLKLKRAMLELELQKENKQKEILFRKIAEIDEEIKQISLANPLNAYFFAFVSAEANSKNEAISKAYERARILCNAIEVILNAEARILYDEEINRAIDIAIFPSGIYEYKNFK